MTAHVVDSLSPYLDGELDPAERAAVLAHLAACEACAVRLQELAAVDAATRALPVEAPEGYFESLPSRVRARIEARTGRAWGVPAWGWAAAAAVVLAVVTPLTLTVRQAPEPTPRPAARPEPALPERAEPEGTPAPASNAAGPAAPLLDRGRDEKASLVGAEAQEMKEAVPATIRESEAERLRNLGYVAGGVEDAAPGPADVTTPAEKSRTGDFAAVPPQAERLAVAEERDRTVAGQPAKGEEVMRREATARKAAHEPSPEGRADARSLAATAATGGGMPLERVPETLEEARSLRETWRRLSTAERDPAKADEAWVRVVDLGALAYRLGRDPRDLERLRKDAREYLRRPDAAQADRIREILLALASE